MADLDLLTIGMVLAGVDLRRILLGENSVSSLVEAKARGFKPGDVNPAADESNIICFQKATSAAAAASARIVTATRRTASASTLWTIWSA